MRHTDCERMRGKPRRGAALVGLVLLIALLNLLAVLALLGSGERSRLAVSESEGVRALAASESGLAAVVALDAGGDDAPIGWVELPSGERYRMDVLDEGGADERSVVTGVFGQAQRRASESLDDHADAGLWPIVP